MSKKREHTTRKRMSDAADAISAQQNGPTAHFGRASKIDWFLLGCLGVIFFAYVLIYDLKGETLLQWQMWDSYTLQDLAWLEGKVALPKNYEWLELAIYNGQYYQSFPPIPGLFMLPLVALMGQDTPSNLVVTCVAIATVTFCYECLLRQGRTQRTAMFWAVFYVMGSNMLAMSTIGGVWFIAQGFSLMFLTAAVWAYVADYEALAMLLASLAVGCRPFSVFFCIALLAIIYLRAVREEGAHAAMAMCLKSLAGPAIVAVCLMTYNYVRFDNPLEFGHNYLPEHVNSTLGQFNLAYIPDNLFNLLLRPVEINSELGLDIPIYDGFMFYIANPLFLVFFWMLGQNAMRKQWTITNSIIVAAFILNLLSIAMHSTLGRWQFGARYTVDLLPYTLLYAVHQHPKRLNNIVLLVGVAAVIFNVYGIFFLFIDSGR